METKTKAPPKLSRVPRGHWRNLWRTHEPMCASVKSWRANIRGQIVLDDHHFVARFLWPSREVAEEKALSAADFYKNELTWLRAEFFPEA